MGALADRFEKLDSSLDIGFKKVNDIVDNKIYSTRKDIEETILGFKVNLGLDKLKGIIDDVNKTINIVKNLPAKIMGQLQALYDKTIGKFLSLGKSVWGNSIQAILLKMNELGVRDFLINMTDIGSVVMCNNLDTLMDFMEGREVSPFIMEGLMFNLAADWLNNSCKDLTRREEMEYGLDEIIDRVVPYTGVPVNSSTLVQDFNALFSGYLNYVENDIKLPYKPADEAWFVSNMSKSKSEMYKAITPFPNMEEYRKSLAVMDKVIKSLNDGKYTANYIKMLNLRGDVFANIPIDDSIINARMARPLAQDAFGSFIRNMGDVDLKKIPTHSYSTEEKAIFDILPKVVSLSNTGSRSSLGHRKGDWQRGALDDISKLFSKDLKTYVAKIEPSANSVRFNGLQTSTAEFLRDGTRYTKPKPYVEVLQ